MSFGKTVRIIGTGMTKLNGPPASPTSLMKEALEKALSSINLSVKDVNGLIAVPSLAEPHFMEAHYLGTMVGLLPGKSVSVRTVDTGGAGPVTGLLEARRMILAEGADLVAVVAGDAVKNLPSDEFLKRADKTCYGPDCDLPSPVIPSGYDRVAQYQMQKFGLKRNQLAMCSSLSSMMAVRHPLALTKTPRSVDDVLKSPSVGNVTNVLECARRADGAAAILVASSSFLKRKNLPLDTGVVVISGGEASGPLYPPSIEDITEIAFSCEEAAKKAYEEAQLSVRDISFFGLYDCFPICLIRALESVGLAPKGKGGDFIQDKFERILAASKNPDFRPQDLFPVNTHGGLLAFGAPWEVPAMYNIIEAYAQLMGEAEIRQIKDCKRALVYGNGGIFSHSAVAILGNGKY